MSIKGYSVATIDDFVGRELGVSNWVVVAVATTLLLRVRVVATVHEQVCHLIVDRRESR